MPAPGSDRRRASSFPDPSTGRWVDFGTDGHLPPCPSVPNSAHGSADVATAARALVPRRDGARPAVPLVRGSVPSARAKHRRRHDRMHHAQHMTARLPGPHTTAQLARSGMTRRELQSRLRSGEVRRATRGVYLDGADGAEVIADTEHVRLRQHHLLMARAVTLALPDSYLVGSSSALALGLPTWSVPQTVHLARRERLRSTRAEVTGHRGWPHPVVEVNGLVTQAATTAVTQIAADDGILAALVSADAALRVSTLDDAGPTLTAFGNRPGAARARTVFEHADGRRESPLETWAFWQAHLAGVALSPQPVIRDEHGEWIATVDFVADGRNVIVEVDGIGKYTRHSDFKNERVRHNQIEELGWIVVRVTAEDLRTGRFVPRLLAALARSSPRP